MKQNQPTDAENPFWIFEADYEAIRDWVFLKEGVSGHIHNAEGDPPKSAYITFKEYFKDYCTR